MLIINSRPSARPIKAQLGSGALEIWSALIFILSKKKKNKRPNKEYLAIFTFFLVGGSVFLTLLHSSVSDTSLT